MPEEYRIKVSSLHNLSVTMFHYGYNKFLCNIMFNMSRTIVFWHSNYPVMNFSSSFLNSDKFFRSYHLASVSTFFNSKKRLTYLRVNS